DRYRLGITVEVDGHPAESHRRQLFVVRDRPGAGKLDLAVVGCAHSLSPSVWVSCQCSAHAASTRAWSLGPRARRVAQPHTHAADTPTRLVVTVTGDSMPVTTHSPSR